MFNEWMDIRYGDPWPKRNLVQALNKSLDTLPGQDPNQVPPRKAAPVTVALAVRGAVVPGWRAGDGPRVERQRQSGGVLRLVQERVQQERWLAPTARPALGARPRLRLLLGALQGLSPLLPPISQEAVVFGEQAKTYEPVHVDHHKGNISPAVLVHEGKHILGKVCLT